MTGSVTCVLFCTVRTNLLLLHVEVGVSGVSELSEDALGCGEAEHVPDGLQQRTYTRKTHTENTQKTAARGGWYVP